jgi:pimeloyl-ACP methyl ester carboxylesterase
VVSLSAPWDYGGVDALAAAKHIDVPTLIMVGEQDEPDFVDSAHKLARAIPNGEGRYIGIVSIGHGTDLLGESVHGRSVMELLADYLTP